LDKLIFLSLFLQANVAVAAVDAAAVDTIQEVAGVSVIFAIIHVERDGAEPVVSVQTAAEVLVTQSQTMVVMEDAALQLPSHALLELA